MRAPIRAHAWARPLSACQPDETIWLFDLDNTLHNASKGIFQAIDGRMRIGVAQTLGVPAVLLFGSALVYGTKSQFFDQASL